jgi:hypothetical protein
VLIIKFPIVFKLGHDRLIKLREQRAMSSKAVEYVYIVLVLVRVPRELVLVQVLVEVVQVIITVVCIEA